MPLRTAGTATLGGCGARVLALRLMGEGGGDTHPLIGVACPRRYTHDVPHDPQSQPLRHHTTILGTTHPMVIQWYCEREADLLLVRA